MNNIYFIKNSLIETLENRTEDFKLFKFCNENKHKPEKEVKLNFFTIRSRFSVGNLNFAY